MSTFEANLIVHRLNQLEEFQRGQEAWRRDVDEERTRHEDQIDHLIEAMDRLLKKMDTLVLAIVAGSITLATSAFIFAVSVLFATGKLGK